MDVLTVLVEGGAMGFLGQGARAVGGVTAKAVGASTDEIFQAVRFFVSLAIGIVVGLAAALIYLMSNPTSEPDWHILLGFVAAGYAGTDFLEGFIAKYITPPVSAPSITTAALTRLSVLPLDEPGQKEQAIMDSITAWLQSDQKLPPGQDVNAQGTMNGTYHFAGPPEIATFLKGISTLLVPKHYNYNYKKDTDSQPTLTTLSTATITAVAYEIGKNTTYMLSGVAV